MMDEQITLFDMFKNREQIERCEQLIEKWKTLPDKTHISESDERRKSIVHEVYAEYCDTYGALHHECKDKPDNVTIWCNVYHYDHGEYWVLHPTGDIAGRKCDVCPYCGADLQRQKGDVVAVKAKRCNAISALERFKREVM